MEYNYGTQDVILAGSGSHTLSKRQYGRCVYYGYSIEGLLESANSHTRDTDCFGILVGSKKNMFSIQVHEIDGLERTIEAPAIICLKEDVIERYEPFSSKEEFIQNYLDHVPSNDGLMSELCGEYLLRPFEEGSDLMAVLAIKDSGLSFIDDMDVSWESVKNNYRFLDGSTCGKKVRWKKLDMQRDSVETTPDCTNQSKRTAKIIKNVRNTDTTLIDRKPVGGTIFYIDDTADGIYEFFDADGNPIESVKVGDKPHSYRVVKKGGKDKYYVYYDEIYAYTAWTYCDDGVFMYEPIGTHNDIGSGKINTAMILTKDNGAYITEDSSGIPTIWYQLQQARNAEVGGCNDWFVPSFKEIEELRKAIKSGTVIGGTIAGSAYEESLFSNRSIWSSSEYSFDTAGLWNYYYQGWGNGEKYGALSTFFVRSF